jgi:hypothetical protein
MINHAPDRRRNQPGTPTPTTAHSRLSRGRSATDRPTRQRGDRRVTSTEISTMIVFYTTPVDVAQLPPALCWARSPEWHFRRSGV